MEIVEKLVKLGFSEAEANVYIELLKNPGKNGTQMSKNLPLSRTAVYKALEALCNKKYIYLIPTEGENKNYNAKNPSEFIESIKIEYKNILDSIALDLQKLYNPNAFFETYNISSYENIMIKLKNMMLEAQKSIVISGKFDEEYIKKLKIDNINIKRINFDNDLEFYCIVDNESLLVAQLNILHPVGIYTKNSIIVSKYIGEQC